ncbi:MAG: SWIM zinc finger family protein [Candidatus Contendobacter sp.]|nr:SWIM zinc finger family protein [Candidatus Contendobacter sp.]
MPAPTFDPAWLPQYATDRSIRRGEDYFKGGAVETLVLRGDELEADVQGNAPRPYRVWIKFDAGGTADATCTCPYEYGGWCKHIVATLLAYAKRPGAVEIRSPLAEKLAALDRSQLQALVLELADRIPRLSDMIEATLPYVTFTGPTGSAAPTAASVDTRALRQSVRGALRSRGGWDEDYDEDSYGVVDDVIELAERARSVLDVGNGRAALAILEAITDEFSKHWEMLEETGEETSVFFDGTAALWIEALLDPSLSADEREQWAGHLADWVEDFDESAAEPLENLQTVVRQGWDDPGLGAILRGEEPPGGLWGDDPPPDDWRVQVTQARLRILAHTGQDEAYLHLAKAEKQYDLYALHLLKLGRVKDAAHAGLELPLSDAGTLELAKALYTRGEIEPAFQIAEHGLQRLDTKPRQDEEFSAVAERMTEFGLYDSHPQSELATWLRDRAAEHGQIERARAAGVIAFRIAPRLAAYQSVQKLAGGDWPDLRRQLLDFLRQQARVSNETRIEIFLYENLVDDAIEATERYTSPRTLARVMDAAVNRQPQWVIAQARRQAEPIMDGTQSAHYEDAVLWLRKTKQAHEALGQQTEWRNYLVALRQKHQRKYKLMPLLKTL